MPWFVQELDRTGRQIAPGQRGDRINHLPKFGHDVEKILHDQKSLEDRKQALIADLLKQREAAIAAFDEKLAKLGYHANSGKTKRSHHKKGGTQPATPPTKATEKPKA